MHFTPIARTKLLKAVVNLFGVATGTLISIPAFAQITAPQVRSFTPANDGSTSNPSTQTTGGSGITITDTLTPGAASNPVPQSVPNFPTPSIPPFKTVIPAIVAPTPLVAPTATNATPLVTPIGAATSLNPTPIPLVAPTTTNATPLVTPLGLGIPTTSAPTPSLTPTTATFVPSAPAVSSTTNR